MKKSKLTYILITATLIVGIFIGSELKPLFSGDNIFGEIKKFNFVLNTAHKNYVNEVDTHKLVESAIKGMLDELDPHSVYISAEDMKSVEEDFKGAFEGIGVEFDVIHDTITVISPIPGGPSESLGIQSGDKIVKIDGEDAVGIPRSDVPKKLRGPKDSKVVVDIKRKGVKKLIQFEIIRDKIPLFTVDASYIIDGTDIGVVVVNRFARTTYKEVTDALEQLTNKGMKKLILDLRGNPGGYLGQAFYMVDEFIPAGDTIVFTKGRLPEFDEAFLSNNGGKFEDLPIIVMINTGSASASEIVSGAIQDLDRGLVVGTTSFGKGLVQRQYTISDGSAFRLTTSKYYTPSGRCIQRPYTDKDKYYHLSGRLDLEDGNYIYNSLKKMKKHLEKNKSKDDTVNINSMPIYYTKNGRLVLGGGGITPDVIVKMDTLTDFGVQVRRKIRFNQFINDFVNVKDIKSKYNNDFNNFLKNYKVDNKLLNQFKKMVKNEDIEWNQEEFELDKNYLFNTMKAYIANAIWNRNEMIQVFYQDDPQINKAKTLFPEAIKISMAE